jgi:hypothetical protein
MLKVGLSVFLALGILNLALLAARTTREMQQPPAQQGTTQDKQRIAELERQILIQREWIRQREEATSGRYVYYSPDSLREIDQGRRDPDQGIVKSVQRGLGGTPYANFGP